MCNCRNVTVLKGDKGDAGATGPQGPAGTMGYNVYVASMTQSETSAPSARILQNTLVDATPTWTRTGDGEYVLTATASFPSYTTKLWIGNTCEGLGDGGAVIPLVSKALTVAGYYTITAIDADSLKMTIFNTLGTKVDLQVLVGVTTRIYLPEIRIYP